MTQDVSELPPSGQSEDHEGHGLVGAIVRARGRARRRKSPWNLLLMLLSVGSLVAITYTAFMLMWQIHVVIYPEHAGGL